ncbi:unnamed protein product [Phaedon cochleariae]|uniref:Cytochrome P450 n=1 Tax=Phaedon cochleariae TaxID=80249 RepID=A0A9P0DNJ2_PHACE|nr:unnamed protein product [Phaedon cochleariae]
MSLFLLVLVLTLICIFVKKNLSYWVERGVPGPQPLPIVGNIGRNILGKVSQGQIFTDIYRTYQEYSFVGIFRGTVPYLLVRDPDFIRNIIVKDFKHFQENNVAVNEDVDPIFARNPFVIKDIAVWKLKRAQLISCFSSGKMKRYYPLLEESAMKMIKYIENQLRTSAPLECRELSVRFSLESVASCVFGIDGKCFEEDYPKFREMADEVLSPRGLLRGLKLTLILSWPSLAKPLKMKFVSKEVEDKLFGTVRMSLKLRKENNVVRNDFLDYLSQLSSNTESFSEMDLIGHAASFFSGGYETTSRAMGFFIFELAMNPECQDKLRQEIIHSYEENGNKFSYESINEMRYLDACFNENMRKNAISHYMTKVCTERYTFTPTNPEYKKMSVTLEPGTPIIIPLRGLLSDPKYWNSPEKFVPERFLDRDSVHKFTYLPFGEGPRICIGQRFGTTQLKVVIAHLLKNFVLEVNSKTQFPVKYNPFHILLTPVEGLWINLRRLK